MHGQKNILPPLVA